MNKTGTTRVTVKPGDPLPQGNTDWTRLDAATDEDVMAAALSDPDAQPLSPEQLAGMRRVSRVKVLRQRLGMTQAEFADAFHLPITTLRDWEQHLVSKQFPHHLGVAFDGQQQCARWCIRCAAMSDACDRKYDIAIWSLQTDPPKLEFKYQAKQYENWDVTAWQDDTHIKVKAFINGKTPYDQEAELLRTGSSWALQLGKKPISQYKSILRDKVAYFLALLLATRQSSSKTNRSLSAALLQEYRVSLAATRPSRA